MTIEPEARARSAARVDAAVPRVSVIVPTHNGAGRLPLLLDALAGQTAPADLFEVLIVDDGSEDETAEVVRASGFARLLQTPENVGPAGASNHGLAFARGDVIAFTDDDTVPAPDWIERGAAATSNGDTVAAGHIELTWKDPPGMAELVDIGRGYLDQANMVEEGYGATANLWIRRVTLERLGGFREIWSSQTHDRDLVERAVAAGLCLRYVPDVVVRHPARRSLRELARKEYRLAKGAAELRRLGVGEISGQRQVWTQPHIYRPWLHRASCARLEQLGLAPRGARRAVLRLMQYVCLQLLQAAGSLVGSLELRRRPGQGWSRVDAVGSSAQAGPS
jgi:GT2 family glycosyltransferase